ncbi:MAG TPA: DNA mismatch repair endonuclease MutL [Candidatus Dorea intestinavium]|nr:DNA mismatch repair endonuclease MutL [Candidatus Dorea intestinavium]
MKKIQTLDSVTIDKIAAGEVIERPASIVKELTENAIDAGATSINIEIVDGGITSIRISDNGEGIEKEDIRDAFLRHSTSKIKSAKDLFSIHTLGFRGEALSSIAAISMVELRTKTKDSDFGISYQIEGGKEKDFREIGTPIGTTFLIQQVFYNTPARRKFLKSPITEAGHINDYVTRLSLSHPEISFHFISNGQTKLHTSGSGKLKEVIFQVYGREIASELLEVSFKEEDLTIKGLIGKPIISRGNRSYENFYVNGRYVKSQILSKATEDAYKGYTMQHRYPFVVLFLNENPEKLDVNVHPTKMEVRFLNTQRVYNALYETLSEGLQEKPLIPSVTLEESAPVPEKETPLLTKEEPQKPNLTFFMEEMKKRVASFHEVSRGPQDQVKEEKKPYILPPKEPIIEPKKEQETTEDATQLNLFDEEIIVRDIAKEYRLIGQLFETYWLIEYNKSLYIIDQHAAHEKVLYEKMIKDLKNKQHSSQMISPPIVLELTMNEARLLKEHLAVFTKIGYEINEFGEDTFSVSGVPANLYNLAKKELLIDMLDHLSEEFDKKVNESIIEEKIASMSCKAAVKGNMHLTKDEVTHLIDQLLQLENPYHCPHGRPTIIAMTKKELEKKFKRIV